MSPTQRDEWRCCKDGTRMEDNACPFSLEFSCDEDQDGPPLLRMWGSLRAKIDRWREKRGR